MFEIAFVILETWLFCRSLFRFIQRSFLVQKGQQVNGVSQPILRLQNVQQTYKRVCSIGVYMATGHIARFLAPCDGKHPYLVRPKQGISREPALPVTIVLAQQSAKQGEIHQRKKLAKLMRKPLLSLLLGAEPGHEKIELDRWWTTEGFSNVSFVELQDIAECFSNMAELRRRQDDSPERTRSRSEQRIKQPASV